MGKYNSLPRRRKERHAKRRIMERFGIELSDDEMEWIRYECEEYINVPKAVNSRNGRSFHHFVIRGISMVILYDWEFSCVLTAYRKKWFDCSEQVWTLRPRKVKAKHRRR